jgi:Na+/proline symporter
MSLLTVLAFNISALAGGIAAPWIYNWISVSRNERAATQCGWGHLWKRVVTLLFAVYGILFFLIDPAIAHPEQAWGDLMRRLLPAGVGLLGLLVASFFAAAMSSVDTYATTSSAMFVDFFYRRVVGRGKSNAHYLALARYWAVGSIVLGAGSTVFISGISDYVKLALSLLSFLGIPILFGVAWRKANRTGAWLSFCLGIGSYIMVMFVTAPSAESFAKIDDQRFYQCVFTATSLSLLGMIAGSLIGKAEDPLRLARFYVILATPVGEEKQLVDAGIRLPALIDAGLIPESPGEEVLRADEVHRLEAAYAKNKLFGEQSTIELRREPTHPWYFRGFVLITISCAGLVVGTWLATRVLFVW